MKRQTVRYIDKHLFWNKMNKPDVQYLDRSVLELVEMDYVLDYRLFVMILLEIEFVY